MAVTWINPEDNRPNNGDKIIFEDKVGLYWGEYYSIRNGIVLINGKEYDEIPFTDIFHWIAYPDE